MSLTKKVMIAGLIGLALIIMILVAEYPQAFNFKAMSAASVMWQRVGLLTILCVVVYGFAAKIGGDDKGKKAVRGGVILFGPILFILLLVLGWVQQKTDEPARPPAAVTINTTPKPTFVLTTDPQWSWPKLVLPAGGDSEKITVPPGTRPVFTDTGYEIRVSYSNRTDCVMGLPRPPCPNGAIREVYLHDETGAEERTILYAFEPF